MKELNLRGKACVAAFWAMPVSLIASLACCLTGLHKAMFFWAVMLGLAAVVFLVLSPQKYVDPEDKLMKRK